MYEPRVIIFDSVENLGRLGRSGHFSEFPIEQGTVDPQWCVLLFIKLIYIAEIRENSMMTAIAPPSSENFDKLTQIYDNPNFSVR